MLLLERWLQPLRLLLCLLLLCRRGGGRRPCRADDVHGVPVGQGVLVLDVLERDVILQDVAAEDEALGVCGDIDEGRQSRLERGDRFGQGCNLDVVLPARGGLHMEREGLHVWHGEKGESAEPDERPMPAPRRDAPQQSIVE
jgi:hypothetical protein